MTLAKIAAEMDSILGESEEAESFDPRGHTAALLLHVFSRPIQVEAAQVGRALSVGARGLEEQESAPNGAVAIDTLRFLEGVVAGLRDALQERMGADPNPDMSPDEFAYQYYMAHNRFPENVAHGAVISAMRKLASRK